MGQVWGIAFRAASSFPGNHKIQGGFWAESGKNKSSSLVSLGSLFFLWPLRGGVGCLPERDADVQILMVLARTGWRNSLDAD
jgi:hypothetical protein